MMLWIIAALAGAVLLAGIAFLALRRDEEAGRDAWDKPRHSQPWDQRPEEPEGSRMASIPPPSGVPSAPTFSEELSLSGFESQELWVDDDDPTGPVAKIVVSAAGGTHPGKKRAHNEDAYLVQPEHEVYAIADGMGGYAAGEVAAEIAVNTLREGFESGDVGTLEDGYPRRGAELMSLIRRCNTRIRQEAARDDEKTGMGTTIVSARFSPGRKRVYIAHVGDSRCYRIRDGEIRQLTTDHTLGAVGIKGPAAAKLSRAVGVFDDLDVDLTIDEPWPGDYYLLCSDGLSKMVPEDAIAATVSRSEDLEETVRELIVDANDRGGRDNVTLVLVRIDGPSFDSGESGEHRLPE